MANVSRGGFWPIRNRAHGGTVNYRTGHVLTAPATAIFTGDAMKKVGTGDWLSSTATTGALTNHSVCMGGEYLDAFGIKRSAKYIPAALAYTGTSYDNPNASHVILVDSPEDVDFEAQVDEAIALTDLFANYDQVLTAGSTVTGFSGHVLDATGHDATATRPWEVLDFIRRTDNDVTLTNAKVVARMNLDGRTGLA